MKKRILITGGSGLLAVNWAISDREKSSIILGMHKHKVNLDGVLATSVNIKSANEFVQDLLKISPSVVIHAAGLTNVEQCESEPDLAHSVNVTLSANVAQACSLLNIKMVHVSTDHLFSGNLPNLTEDTPVEPINIYGKSKALAEASVMKNNSQALIVRTNFYGWGTSYRTSFTDKVIKALRAKKTINLFQDVFFTPISIPHFVEAVKSLISTNESGVFNIVGDERLSKYEFGLKVAQEFGLDSSLIKPSFLHENSQLVQRPYDMSLSNKKIRDLLGKDLGDVKEHLGLLHLQEISGLAREVSLL